jgi:uncharacterized damage-inducible protein DinB
MASDGQGESMTALSAEELMAWVDTTSEKWEQLLEANPDLMSVPCDVMEVGTVARLLQHIVAVELRYAQRLAGLEESAYEDVGYASPGELYGTHRRAMEMLRERLSRQDVDWEERIQFKTRSAGVVMVSRRTVLVHSLMHSIRHYAQLATLSRQHGVKPGWPMDYLFMGASLP